MARFYVTGILFGIILLLVALAAVAMLAYVIYYYVVAGVLAPTRRVMAEVVRKHQAERTSGSASYFGDNSDLIDRIDDSLGLMYDFYMVFQVGDRSLEFSVPMSVYADVTEGDTGMLVHKGNLFRRFIKGAAGWSDPVPAPIQQVKP